MGVKSPASALGEAVGKLIENGVRKVVEELTKEYGLKIGTKKLVDKVGIDFEIDLPIFKDNEPIALIDVKYLRYKKHARDKSSWVVVAHNRLKASYPSIKKTLVILLGTGWTEGAKKLISTSCIDVVDIDPTLLNRILSKYGIIFVWDEKDEVIPKDSWQKFKKLTEEDIKQLTMEIITESGIEETLRTWFEKYILERDPPNDEKLRLNYICENRVTLNHFISERE